MTNEELVMEIKNGHSEHIETLWLKIKRLITHWAHSWMLRGGERLNRLCDVDDLVQSGYFAMIKAIRYYHEDCGYRFVTGLSYTVRSEFARAAFGMWWRKGKQTTELDTVSIDAPIGPGCDSDADPLNLFPDPAALQAFEDADQIMTDEAAHKMLEDIMSTRLSEVQHKTMQAVFFDGIPENKYAEQRGVSQQAVSFTIAEACHILRSDSCIRHLYKSYIGTDPRDFDLLTAAYHGTGRTDRTEKVATQLYYANRRKDRKRKLMDYLGLDEQEWNELIG